MSDNSEIRAPLFGLGQVVATPAAVNAIAELGLSPLTLIHRHVTGDWGDLSAEDQQSNRLALGNGTRIFSNYKLGITSRVWIITEADRSATTLLIPNEY